MNKDLSSWVGAYRASTSPILVLATCCALAWPTIAGAAPTVFDDPWDVSQGTSIMGSSPVLNSAANLIGGASGIEAGNVLFSDAYPAGYIHWVEWQTTDPVMIGQFNLVAIHETTDRRSMDHFALFAWTGGGWNTVLYDEDIPLPYGGGPNYPASNYLELNAPVDNVVLADLFRAEFTQASTVPSARGPRIAELDGYLVPEPSTMGLLVLGGLTAILRHRRRTA
jgi:hypothetical protein